MVQPNTNLFTHLLFYLPSGLPSLLFLHSLHKHLSAYYEPSIVLGILWKVGLAFLEVTVYWEETSTKQMKNEMLTGL